MALARNVGEHRSKAVNAKSECTGRANIGEPDPNPSPVVRFRTVRKGSRIFDASAAFLRTYVVASGEVLILRGGRPVDLVETGELVDPRIWQDATAIAFTDCTLSWPRAGL